MQTKKRVLFYGDSPVTSTGFGVVVKNIAKTIYATGKYDIDILGINFSSTFYDKKEFPYQIIPAKLEDPNDPYGLKMFAKIILTRQYDIIWIVNDVPVLQPIAKYIGQMRESYAKQKLRPPVLIYYYPIDCTLIPEASDMVKIADIPVAYTYYGVKETLRHIPEVKDRLRQIYHGMDNAVYHPLSSDERLKYRKQYLKAEENDFVIVNVNRNSVRKQMPHTILAFSEFKKHVPNSKLYLHTNPRDRSPMSPMPIDLIRCCKDLNLDVTKDVLFPVNYSPAAGYPEYVLNQFYNCADLFMANHLGEGMGLSVIEAMAAGVPVLVGNNTNMPEFDGVHLYECKDKAYVDNSGYRLIGHTQDIVDQMLWIYNNRNKKEVLMSTEQARQWAIAHDWNIVNQAWVKIFEEAERINPLEVYGKIGNNISGDNI